MNAKRIKEMLFSKITFKPIEPIMIFNIVVLIDFFMFNTISLMFCGILLYLYGMLIFNIIKRKLVKNERQN